MLWLVVVAVELLIFMCVNKLLAGTSDPTGMIYPDGYESGENSPPMTGMGILAVPNFYGGSGSGMAIPDGDLPIAILNPLSRAPLGLPFLFFLGLLFFKELSFILNQIIS